MLRTSNHANGVTYGLGGRQRNRSLMACFCLAMLLAGLRTQSAHAATSGRYLYVVDKNVAMVEGFTMTNLTTGALKTLGACANFPVGFNPNAETTDPTGNYLYIADAGGANVPGQIFGFTIAALTGCLAPMAGSPWPTKGAGPQGIHVTGDGNYVYVTDLFGGAANIEGFQITPGGILAHMGGTPFPYGANPGGLAFDSVGPFLLAADDSPAGVISAWDPAGLPVPSVPAPACPSPTFNGNPTEMSATPAGQDMLVLSAGGISLDSYQINRWTGCLGFVNTLPLAADQHSVYTHPFGRYAYVTSSVGDTVQAYTISSTGIIAVDGPVVGFAPGAAPAKVVVDAWGKFVYISLSGASQIAGYTITPKTGKLVAIGGSPWNTFVPAAGPTAVHAVTP
jgi:6-phosphogluconolactonase (cycloisomerase 2 family)